MRATVIKAGPLTTIQDLGRTGGLRQGVSPGGAMDQRAVLWANRLLGNPSNAPVLEITLGGAVLEFKEKAVIAMCGADFGATLDGKRAGNWRSVRVGAGQSLRFGMRGDGVRVYVAVPGGFESPRWFGSASVVLREGLSGALGRPVEAGDSLRWTGVSGDRLRSVPHAHIPAASAELVLPLIEGYEWNRFSIDDRERIYREEWDVDPRSDRVAVRLSGPPMFSGPDVLDSVPLVDGTVQIPADGTPLIFMRDRPTIGGYAKIGSVSPLALDDLAQAAPGTRVRFAPADVAAIIEEMNQRRLFFGE